MKHLTSIQRFWISLVLVIPMLIQMLAMPFHWNMPGYTWIAFITTTLIMLVAALPYWTSAWAAFKHHNANMNTLVAIGTSIAYFYSLFAMITGRPVYFECGLHFSLRPARRYDGGTDAQQCLQRPEEAPGPPDKER